MPALAATLTICIVFFPVVMLRGAGALPVHAAGAGGGVLDAGLVPAVAHAGAVAGAQAAAASEQHRGRSRGRFNALARSAASSACATPTRARWSRARAPARCSSRVVRARRGVSLLLVPVVGLRLLPSGRHRADAPARARAGRARASRTPRSWSVASRQAIREIIPADELATINDNIGVPTFYNLAFVPTDNVGGQDAEVLIQLAESTTRPSEYRRGCARAAGRSSPSAQLLLHARRRGHAGAQLRRAATIDVQIEGRDPDASLEIARDAAREIRAVPGAEDVRIAQVFDHPALRSRSTASRPRSSNSPSATSRTAC